MRTISGLFGIGAMLLSATCNADAYNNGTPRNWKTECVGRYQVSVPGEVEVALRSSKHFFDENDWSRKQFRFVDDTVAEFSSGYDVYPKMDNRESVQFMNAIKKMFDKNIAERYQESHSVIDKNFAHWLTFSGKVNNRDFAWVELNAYSLFLYRDERYFFFGNSFDKSDSPAKDTEKSVAEINANINTFYPRALYELHKQQGVCIPYGFIADDGTAPRSIAVTIRLIDHPDIEIGFRDQSYSKSTMHIDKDQYAPTFGHHGAVDIDYNEPKNAINDFFPNVIYADEKVKPSFMGLHSAHMGGQKGGAIFVDITRADGSPDFGYVIAVKGSNTENIDNPSQLLYVIRTAARAKGTPVSKEELKDMAEKIVASVKRHPVQ